MYLKVRSAVGPWAWFSCAPTCPSEAHGECVEQRVMVRKQPGSLGSGPEAQDLSGGEHPSDFLGDGV